jgi:uncharacterized membrane protein
MPGWNWNQAAAKQIAQMIISLIVLISCIALIFGDYHDDFKKWAFGMIGVVVGYWFK